MVMTLNLDFWETVSLTAGCNLYSAKFRLCVLTVRSNDQQLQGFGQDAAMYFRERDKPVVPAETFLATAVPKFLMGSLIVFLNVVAIIAMIRSNRWSAPSYGQGVNSNGYHLTSKGYVLPQSTQGLLHSLFVTYLIIGLLTIYSQVSLSTFLLGDIRIVEDQGKECLVVNSVIIAFSVSIALHLVSLGVDRTLASYLSHQKYSSLTRGTVPLWLLSIWLPSMILGSLPLAGWKTNFSFCVFLLQFNDDYLRFVSGFFLTCIILIPLLYLFFLSFLRQRAGPRVLLYRWHRKLQAHHRLTFALVLAVNTGCWAPFHVYLLLACQSCPYAAFGSGFTLEYLFILALVPSLIIPLMFSLRSTFVDKCAQKMTRCVTFSNNGGELSEAKRSTGSLPRTTFPKSPLFFIDDYRGSSSSSSNRSNENNHRYQNQKQRRDATDGGNGNGSGNFFVPHYLPKGQRQSSLEKEKNKLSTPNNKFKSSFKNKYDSYTQKQTLPCKNFCAYLNVNANEEEIEQTNLRNANANDRNINNTYNSLESDYKYGFPIIPTHDSHIHTTHTRPCP